MSRPLESTVYVRELYVVLWSEVWVPTSLQKLVPILCVQWDFI